MAVDQQQYKHPGRHDPVQSDANAPRMKGASEWQTKNKVQGMDTVLQMGSAEKENPLGLYGSDRAVLGLSVWHSGICDCFKNKRNCCITSCFPCVTFGQIAEIADGGYTPCFVHGLVYGLLYFVGVPCFYSCIYRSKFRAQFGLPETPCNDFCVHCSSDYCALCQEYRELESRGIDPYLGWKGNAHMFMTPPEAPVMNM
eukprot:c21816_g1_i1 orf=638-1234(-)